MRLSFGKNKISKLKDNEYIFKFGQDRFAGSSEYKSLFHTVTEIFDRIDRMTNSYGIFFTQSQWRDRLPHTWVKHSIQSGISCQNQSVSSQRVHVTVGASSQVNSSFLAN